MAQTELVVLGAVLLIVGILTVWLCVGIPILIVGIVLLIYGLVHEEPRPMFMYPGYAPAYVPQAAALCPACGSPMQWVPQYSRWYCPRCGAYR
ncbi:MAG TPA: hypothetical protein VI915_05645 [Thermoplasmata archaeon]|nr:hypothetical protein [Thermoplasmata archaeon]